MAAAEQRRHCRRRRCSEYHHGRLAATSLPDSILGPRLRGSSQSTAAPVTLSKPTVAEHLYKYKERYLLLLPAIVLFIVFRYVPMAGIVLAWKRFTVTGCSG